MPKANGGRTALAGYLYQVVGILGMSAWAHCPDDPVDAEELEALLKLVRNSDLLHEYLDQDAVIRSLGIDQNDECIFVQFKFSRQATPPTIGPQVLIEIVKQLITSERAAKRLGQSVTGYALITNRQIGPQSKEIIEAAEKNQEHEKIKTHRKTEKQATITKAEQCSVLQKLRLITELSQNRWHKALQKFARQYGAEDQEIEKGINQLTTALVRQTTEEGLSRVVEADLLDAFIGHREADGLTSKSVERHSAKQLSDFSKALGLVGQPVRRELLDKISDATIERALVVLYGLGGCGKTVGLWHWLEERATGLKMIDRASSVRYPWIAELICGWCNLPSNHARRSQSRARALARLQIANLETEKPILYLGLDGLDENITHVEQIHNVRDILRWFWQEDQASRNEDRRPLATLVVTCRDLKNFEEYWLGLGLSGFNYQGARPLSIEIGDFSSDELLRAAKIGLPEFFGRFQSTIEFDNSPEEEFGVSFHSSMIGPSATIGIPTSRSAPKIGAEVLSSLKHPAMWRAFLELDPQTQSAVLDGQINPVHKMARVFVEWFCRKVRIRGVSQLEVEDLLLILKDIACYSKNNAQFVQTIREWIDPACASNMITAKEARQLQAEALLAGLIEPTDRRLWRWRHQLVMDYLVVADIDE